MRQRAPAMPGSAFDTSPDVKVRRWRRVTPKWVSDGSCVHQSKTSRAGVSKDSMPSATTPAIASATGNLEDEASTVRVDIVCLPFSNVCWRPDAFPTEKDMSGRKLKFWMMESTRPQLPWSLVRTGGGCGL
eukprot:scaffold1002_cov117-Isochrysis_galbana.AAC.7